MAGAVRGRVVLRRGCFFEARNGDVRMPSWDRDDMTAARSRLAWRPAAVAVAGRLCSPFLRCRLRLRARCGVRARWLPFPREAVCRLCLERGFAPDLLTTRRRRDRPRSFLFRDVSFFLRGGVVALSEEDTEEASVSVEEAWEP